MLTSATTLKLCLVQRPELVVVQPSVVTICSTIATTPSVNTATTFHSRKANRVKAVQIAAQTAYALVQRSARTEEL